MDSPAQTEWKRVVPLLLAVRCLAESDLAVLASYCTAWARFRKATLAIQKHGLTMECPQGTLRRPEVAIAAEAERALIRSAGELGLSPAARTRVHAGAPSGEEDEAKAFFGH